MAAVTVRVFEGERWSAARPRGDYPFDLVPAPGQRIAYAAGAGAGWEVATVLDVAHRFGGEAGAADVALLTTAPISGGDAREALPLALLDELAGHRAVPRPAPAAPASVPRSRPWG